MQALDIQKAIKFAKETVDPERVEKIEIYKSKNAQQ